MSLKQVQITANLPDKNRSKIDLILYQLIFLILVRRQTIIIPFYTDRVTLMRPSGFTICMPLKSVTWWSKSNPELRRFQATAQRRAPDEPKKVCE